MLRENNFCISYNKTIATRFNIESFAAFAQKILPLLNIDDSWIRSGAHITAKYKKHISSLKLLGSFTDAEMSTTRIELLQVSVNGSTALNEGFGICAEFVCRYLIHASIDAALVAFVSADSQNWKLCYVRSPRFCSYEIPADILQYICVSAVTNHIADRCSLSSRYLVDFLTNDVIFFDDSKIRENAKLIDNTLKEILFCDPAVGSGQIANAMINLIVNTRLLLNKYLGHKNNRTAENFISECICNSLYATDSDIGAIESYKAELRLCLENNQINDNNIIWGNVLLENLFDNTAFDIVVSNPPHMKQNSFSFIKDKLTGYACDGINTDIYCYYAERTFSLLKEKGTVALMMSNRWLRADYGKGLRAFLSKKRIKEIIDYGNTPALSGSRVPVSIIIAENGSSDIVDTVSVVAATNETSVENISEYIDENRKDIPQTSLTEKVWTFTEKNSSELMDKIYSEGIALSNYVKGNIFRGILTGDNKAFVLPADKAKEIIGKSETYKEVLIPFLSGRNVKRYNSPTVKKYLICFPRGFTKKRCKEQDPLEWFVMNYPDIAEHLVAHYANASKRKDQGDFWWELRSFKHYDKLAQPKIICPSIVSKISATMDTNGLYSNDKTSVIASGDYYLLGLLNSRMMDFYFRHISTELLNGYYNLKPSDLAALPIKVIKQTNSFSVKYAEQISDGAKTLCSLYAIDKTLWEDSDNEKALKAEQSINNAVYKLYKLTRSEIKIIENE